MDPGGGLADPGGGTVPVPAPAPSAVTIKNAKIVTDLLCQYHYDSYKAQLLFFFPPPPPVVTTPVEDTVVELSVGPSIANRLTPATPLTSTIHVLDQDIVESERKHNPNPNPKPNPNPNPNPKS